MRQFQSDNCAGLCPEAMQAIVEANDGSHWSGYGGDPYTTQAEEAFKGIFGSELTVFFVATGTAANTLAIASLTEPWHRVLCHGHSHYNDDESTAPERITHCRVTQIVNDDSKLSLEEIEQVVARPRPDVHQPQPGVLSISNVTEFGTIYTPSELHAICDLAHAHGYRVHLDGARFANAVAANNCDPRELTNEVGIDALSFGGTKNGLAAGEAVVFFPQGDGEDYRRAIEKFPYHRKGTGHLLSKHRFISAPFAKTLSDGSWLTHAAHANAMGRQLSDGLIELGFAPRFPTQANGVFVSLPDAIQASLTREGFWFYPFGEASWNMIRFMCSFDTTSEDVQRFLDVVKAAKTASGN